MAVGAGGACTVGENGLGCPGSMRGAFSVGATGVGGAGVAGGVGGAGGDVVVVVVVVVVVSGAFSSSWAHEAVNPTIATIPAPPASAATRRAIRLMISSYLPDLYQLLKISPAKRNSNPKSQRAHSGCAA